MSSDRYLAYSSTFDSDICGRSVTGSVLHEAEKERDKDFDLGTEGVEDRGLTAMLRALARLQGKLDT